MLTITNNTAKMTIFSISSITKLRQRGKNKKNPDFWDPAGSREGVFSGKIPGRHPPSFYHLTGDFRGKIHFLQTEPDRNGKYHAEKAKTTAALTFLCGFQIFFSCRRFSRYTFIISCLFFAVPEAFSARLHFSPASPKAVPAVRD